MSNTSEQTVDEYIKSIILERLQNQEHFIAHYLNSTGYRIQDIELVEQRSKDGFSFSWYCRLKPVRPDHEYD